MGVRFCGSTGVESYSFLGVKFYNPAGARLYDSMIWALRLCGLGFVALLERGFAALRFWLYDSVIWALRFCGLGFAAVRFGLCSSAGARL